MKMCLGAQLYTVRDYMTNADDFKKAMKRIAEIGYKAVQMSGYNTQEITPEMIREESEKNHLKVVLTHYNPERIKNETEKVIEEHNLFHCDGIGIGGFFFGPHTYDGFMKFTEDFAPAAEKIKKAGKVFLYHNHRFEFEKFNGKYGVELVLENTDPAAVKLTFDAYWAVAAGVDPAAFIRKYGDRIYVTHFKDMTVKDDKCVMTELLTGNMNYDAIMAACAEKQIRYLFVEQDNVTMDSLESMKISHDNMKARYDLD